MFIQVMFFWQELGLQNSLDFSQILFTKVIGTEGQLQIYSGITSSQLALFWQGSDRHPVTVSTQNTLPMLMRLRRMRLVMNDNLNREDFEKAIFMMRNHPVNCLLGIL